MVDLLLCGNGINIQFNEKFKLSDFIELLKNKNKVMKWFDDIIKITKYKKFKVKDLEFFLKMLKKSESNLDFLIKSAKLNGVEKAIIGFLETVDKYMANKKNNKEKYDNFEQLFKTFFFYYLWSLTLNHISFIRNKGLYEKFKEKLESYLYIYTLNYDSILEEIIDDKEDIIHLHGQLLLETTGDGLNFEKCLLETYRQSKSSWPLPELEIIKNSQEHVEKFTLDIIGINPINDEKLFAMFIHSNIFKTINFYYHSENDLKNLRLIFWANYYELKKIEWNKFNISFDKTKNQYILIFSSDIKCIINLIPSEKFWTLE